MENLDTELQSKLEGLIHKNMASLNLEQDEWSKALHQMASLSTDIVLGRADIDKKCCKVEEKARVVEEEVWHRQASTASLNSSCTQSESHGGFGEPAQQKVRGKSWQEKVVRVREALEEASTPSKKVEALLVPTLDEVAWLLNIRGGAVPHIPGQLGHGTSQVRRVMGRVLSAINRFCTD